MNKTRKLTALAAATAALAMLLAGCGAGNGNGSSNASSATEPPAGIDSSYTGDLPMPKVTERYDNHQSRDNVKDGGTLTLSITEVGPNWNSTCLLTATPATCPSCGAGTSPACS